MQAVALVVATLLLHGAEPAASPAEQHTTAGELALEAGDDAKASAEFARAYELLDDDQRVGEIAIMLVDEGVAASVRAWDETGDAAHLERARALLLAHAADLERASPRHQEIMRRLLEIDAKLGIEDPQVEVAAAAPPPPASARPTDADADAAPDPVAQRLEKQRLAGLILTPIGSAIFVTGIGVFASFVVKAREFSEQLRDDKDTFEDAGCGLEPIPTMVCAQLESNIDYYRDNGRRANRMAVGGATFAAIGLVTAIVGVALLGHSARQSKRRAIAWRPTVGGLELRF